MGGVQYIFIKNNKQSLQLEFVENIQKQKCKKNGY